ncbi:MAG: hypothetical protein CMB31_02605 [Euryarchaeota archaeon]|nr:hypothetical protein [Euryarchaeota archaeon]
MVSHGHQYCPHCDYELVGEEPLCPSCSGALFGVARRQTKSEIAKDTAKELANRTTSAISSVTEKAGSIGKSAISTVSDGFDKASSKIGESVSTLRGNNESVEDNGMIPIFDADDEPEDNIEINSTQISNESIDETSRLVLEGEALAAAGKPHEAAHIFRNAIASDPTNADCWFNLGVVQEQMGNADESIKSFHVALVHESNHGPAMANLAVLLDAIGDDGASNMAKKALEHFPGHPVLVKISTSDSVLEPTISPESSTPSPSAGLVIGTNTSPVQELTVSENEESIQDESNQLDEIEHVEESPSIDTYQSTIETWGPDQDNEMNRAAEMLRSGASLDVIAMIEGDFIQRYGNQARPYKILGAAYALQDRVEDAISSFTTGLNIDNNDAPGWYNLGRLHIRNGHQDAGFTCFTASQMVDSTHIASARAIVEYLQGTTDYSKLVPAWIHLSTLEDLGDSAPELARILVEIGEGESIMIESNPDLPRTLPEGPELGQTAVELLKDDESELMVRALSLAGNHTEATRISKSILERNTDDSSSWRLMAKVLDAQGNSDRASQCRDKANKLDGSTDIMPEESVITNDVVPESLNNSEESLLISNEESTTESEVEVDPWGDLVEHQNIADENISEQSTPVEDTSSLFDTQDYVDEITVSEQVIEEIDVNEIEPAISAADLLAPVENDVVQNEPEPNPSVDLAKAALDAASKVSENQSISVSTDSGAMSNSSVEWYNKALFLMEDKKYSEALSCFDKALVGAAEDEDLAIRVLNGRGHAFYYMEQYPEAIKAYFEAMRINKDKVTGATLYNMGTAYAFVELYDDAIKCFKQAMPRGLEDDQKKMCKEQIKRCNELQKIQKRKLSR